MEISGNYLLHT